MNCAECKEQLVAYTDGLLAEPQRKILEVHLKDCQICQAEAAELTRLRNRLVANGNTLAQTNLEDKVLNRIVREQQLKLRKVNKFDNQFQLWRTIMKSKITRLAVAAAIIIIAALSITLLDKSVTPAYAIEQTIQACHTVRYLHVKAYTPSQDEPKEIWVEFDPSGQVKNLRLHVPEWDSPDDGAKVIVWKDNKAQAWLEKKNLLVTVKDKIIAVQILKSVEEFDPRLAVERLYEREAQGKIEIEIEEPSNKAEPIVVTATNLTESLPDSSQSYQERELREMSNLGIERPIKDPFRNIRVVLFVDQATKLVTVIELYKLKDGEYQRVVLMEYYDYNQPIEPEMFVLDQVPGDALKIDQTTQEVGLVQGQLSDEEIAVEVIRQFLQALIEKDYAKAGRLWGGVPAERMKKAYGQIRFIRIISIGEPVPHPQMGALYVPCTVEIEENGEISQWQPEHSYVRQVHGQPGCWEIIGGFRGI